MIQSLIVCVGPLTCRTNDSNGLTSSSTGELGQTDVNKASWSGLTQLGKVVGLLA